MLQFTLLTLLFVVLVVYLWLRHLQCYWTRRGVPQADTCLLFGNLLDALLARKDQGEVYDDIYRQFPDRDAVGFYELTTPKLMLRSPALIQKVLISDFSSFHDNQAQANLKYEPYLQFQPFIVSGDTWKNARAALNPAFTASKVKDMYQLMLETVPLLYEHIDDHEDGELEALELATLFVMTNISNSVFGVVNNCFKDANSYFRKMADMIVKSHFQNWLIVLILLYLPNVKNLLRIRIVPKQVSRLIEDMVSHVSEIRLNSGIRRQDFMQYYLDQKKPKEEILFDTVSHGHTFFVAGIDTSTAPSSYALYQLAFNQEIQEKLHQELREAFQDKNDLEFDTLLSLPYLEKVMQETMRMYPAMFANIRVCTKTTQLEIDGRDIKIEAGTTVVVPVYSLYRDPQHFPEPEVFDPERFNEENIAVRTPYTYMPFGDGPKSCPGIKFGQAQVKLFLASVLHRYRVVPCRRTPPTLTLHKGSINVLPAEKEWLRFEKRK